MLLLEQKKDKCIEIFRTSSLIHDILQKIKSDEHLQPLNLDLNAIIQLMFNDKHFLNSNTNHPITPIIYSVSKLTREETSSKQA